MKITQRPETSQFAKWAARQQTAFLRICPGSLFHVLTFLLLLATIVAITARGMAIALDIGGSDEDSYALVGQLLPAIKPLANWAPLYSYWYAALFAVFRDATVAYLFNAQILYGLTTVFVFLALVSLRVPITLAFLVGWFYAITPGAVTLSPRVYQFTLLLVLLTVCIAARFSHRDRKVSICATGAILLSFIRPELFPIGCILWLSVLRRTLVSQFGLQKRLAGFSLVTTVTLLVISSLPLVVIGNPLSTAEYNRSFEAFTQGFALNLTRYAQIAINPYGDIRATTALYFGDSHSVLDALRHAPGWVITHIFWNLRSLVELVPHALAAPFAPSELHGSTFASPSVISSAYRWLWLAPLILIVSVIRTSKPKLSDLKPEQVFLALVLGSVIVANLVTILDYRHAFSIGFLVIVMLSTLAQRGTSERAAWLLITAVSCTLLTPTWLLPLTPAQRWVAQPNLSTIALVRVQTQANVNALTICPRYLAAFVAPRFAIPFSQDHSFSDATRRSELVVIGPTCSEAEISLRAVSEFEVHAASLGYAAVAGPGAAWGLRMYRSKKD